LERRKRRPNDQVRRNARRSYRLSPRSKKRRQRAKNDRKRLTSHSSQRYARESKVFSFLYEGRQGLQRQQERNRNDGSFCGLREEGRKQSQRIFIKSTGNPNRLRHSHRRIDGDLRWRSTLPHASTSAVYHSYRLTRWNEKVT